MVDARGDRDPGDPMGERDRPVVLVEPSEHLEEDFLAEILLGDPAGEPGPHDPNDHGVKVLNQGLGGQLITPANPFEAQGLVERFRVGR